eukprot:5686460-Pyramimonas_sp.AAC.1
MKSLSANLEITFTVVLAISVAPLLSSLRHSHPVGQAVGATAQGFPPAPDSADDGLQPGDKGSPLPPTRLTMGCHRQQ